jgi:hypothetical protein
VIAAARYDARHGAAAADAITRGTMGQHELGHLQKMLEQIAANIAQEADAEQAVAAHLRRFWAPELRAQIKAAHAGGIVTLSPLAAAAVQRL